MTLDDTSRRLCWHGAFLFLAGLLTGFVVPQFVNPRMGLAAHLEGVMNGTFLIALGAIWPKVRLRPRATKVAIVAVLYGTWVNWATTTFAAAAGTASLTPLAAGAHTGEAWQEAVAMFGLASVSLAMVLAVVLVLVGLRRPPTQAAA